MDGALAAKALPELLGQMWCERREQVQERDHAAGPTRPRRVEEPVRELHHRRDGGVEVVGLEVGGDLLHGALDEGIERGVTGPVGVGRRERDRPDAIEESRRAFDPRGVPIGSLGPGTHEHHEDPERVRTVALHILVGCADVPARFRHLLAAKDDRALVSQVDEGLVEPERADVTQDLRHKTGIEQVEDGVLDPSRVPRDR